MTNNFILTILFSDPLPKILTYTDDITIYCLAYTSKEINAHIVSLLIERKILIPKILELCAQAAEKKYFGPLKWLRKLGFPLNEFWPFL